MSVVVYVMKLERCEMLCEKNAMRLVQRVMRNVMNWRRENKIAMLFERNVAANNLLYGRSGMQNDVYSAKLDRRPSDSVVSSVLHFFKRNMKTMKRNDYKRRRDI
jgi:hypothetical protein